MENIKRNSFVFYESFYTSIECLEEQTRNEILNVVIVYGLTGIIPENISPVAMALFQSFKPQIDKNNLRYVNSKNGGAPSGNNNALKNNQKQPKTTKTEKKQPNVNDNVNDNVNVNDIINNIEKRKNEFKNELAKILNSTRLEYIEKKEVNKEFFEYWTEHGLKDKLMRYEKQGSFSIERRLDTWHRNSVKFKPQQQSTGICR